MAAHLKILIADHDLHFRDQLVRTLRDSGVMLLVVDNARDIARSLAGEHVDAALLDLKLPGMENMDLLGELRNGDSAASNLPIILSSPRRVSKNEVNLALSYRVNAMMPKPFNAQDLIEKLMSILPEDRRGALPEILAEGAPLRGTTAVGDLVPEAKKDISEVDTGVVGEKDDDDTGGKKKKKKPGAKKKKSKRKPTRTKITGDAETSSADDTGEIKQSKKKTEKAEKSNPLKKATEKLDKKEKTASKPSAPKTRVFSKTSLVAMSGKHAPHFLDEKTRSSLRVLLVDGEDPFRGGAVEFLVKAGFQADGVATPDEALGKLDKEKYRILVSESAFEEKPATGFLRKVREAHPDISICIIARDPEVVPMDEALRAGVLEYLAKPLSSTQLVLTVERTYVRQTSEPARAKEALPTDEQVARLEEDLKAAKEDTQHAQGEISAAIEEIQKYEHKLSKQEDEYNRLKVAYANLKSKKKRTDDEETSAEEPDENLRKLEQAKKEIESLRKELEAARAESARVREALEAAEQVQSDTATARAERDAALADVEKTKSELETARTEMENVKSEVEVARASRDQIAAERDAFKEEHTRRDADADAVQNEFEQLRESLRNKDAESESIKGELARLEQKLSDRDTEIAAVSIERDEMGTALRQKTDQLQRVAEEREEFGMRARILEEELKGISRGSDANKADALRLRKRLREHESVNKQLRHDLEETHAELMHAAAESAVTVAADRKELEGEVSRYREALEMAHQEIKQMSPEISTAAQENEKFVNEIESLTRERNNLKEQLDSVSELLGAGAGDAGSVELLIRNLREERDLLERQLAETQAFPGAGSQALDARIRQLEDENQRMASALASARHSDLDVGSAPALETINKLRVKLAKIKSERDLLETEKNRLDGFVRQLEERSTRYPAVPAGIDPGAAVENKILRAEVDELRRRLAASKPDTAALEAENRRKDELIRHLEDRVTELARSQAAGGYGDPGSSAENRILKAEVDELRRKLAMSGPDNALFEAEKTRLMERVRHLEEENARLATSIATARHSEYDHGGRFSRAELDEMHNQLITTKAERVSLEAERSGLSEQVRRLQEENSQLAASLASARHGTADIDTRVMRAELEELRKQLETARSGRGSFDTERNAMMERMARLEEENSKLAAKLELKSADFSRTEEGTRKIRAEYKDLRKQFDKAESGRGRFSTERDVLKERIESLEDENSKLAAELATARFGHDDAETRKMRAELEVLHNRLEATGTGHDSFEAERGAMTKRIQRLEEENSKLAKELASARFGHDDAGARKIRAELEVLRSQVDATRSGRDTFDAERDAMMKRIQRLEEENSELALELAAAKHGRDDVGARKMRAEFDEVRNQLSQAKSDITSFEIEKRRFEAELDRIDTERDELTVTLARARSSIAESAEFADSDALASDGEKEWLRKRVNELEDEVSRLHIEIEEARTIISEIEDTLES